MTSSPQSSLPVRLPVKFSRRTGACLFLVAGLWAVPSRAQDTPPAPPSVAPASPATPATKDEEAPRSRRRSFDPAEFQTRMLARLREQFEVKDDAEWDLISQRILTVFELRASAAGGGFGMMFGRGQRNQSGPQANPEQQALRSAVDDHLPEAEIKARLDRFRVARKATEAKLDKAREDLRSILTVRQEAVAVLLGLLP